MSADNVQAENFNDVGMGNDSAAATVDITAADSGRGLESFTLIIDKSAAPHVEIPDADYVFRRDGNGYLIKGLGESGHFRGTKGFDDLFRLVQSPGRQVPMAEIDSGTDSLLLVADAERSIQEALDSQAQRQIQTEVDRLIVKIKAGDAGPEMEQLQAKLSTLESHLRRSTGLRGKSRDLNSANDKLRPKILGRIRTARQLLSLGNCPRLAEHFSAAITTEGANIMYTSPGPEVLWVV